jgi:hypothetical protein
MTKFLVAVVVVIAMLSPAMSYGATTTTNLAWDANTETDLAGYKLYQSAGPTGTKTLVQTIPKPATTTAVTGLVDGNWCWVLTAYDTTGNESGYSNQVCLQADTIAPAAPKALRIASTVVIP